MTLLTKAEAIALIQRASSIAEMTSKQLTDLSKAKSVRILVLR